MVDAKPAGAQAVVRDEDAVVEIPGEARREASPFL
jgi:hypothetical protein